MEDRSPNNDSIRGTMELLDQWRYDENAQAEFPLSGSKVMELCESVIALRAKLAEAEAKGESLCCANGDALIRLAALEAECADYRKVLAKVAAETLVSSTTGRIQRKVADLVEAALSRPPGSTEALRAMVMSAAVHGWQAGWSAACHEDDTIKRRDVDAIVARLLGDTPKEVVK